jgi:hypothetical protein
MLTRVRLRNPHGSAARGVGVVGTSGAVRANRYATEENYWQAIVWVSGLVQTVLYFDFFYNYVKSKRKSLYQPIDEIALPV